MFKVFDKNGKDVTNEHNWFIDAKGSLYYRTKDMDNSLYCVAKSEGYSYIIKYLTD